jgi:hypothetical protein
MWTWSRDTLGVCRTCRHLRMPTDVRRYPICCHPDALLDDGGPFPVVSSTAACDSFEPFLSAIPMRIAVAGKAGSGKTTLNFAIGDALGLRYGYDYKIYSFAEKLKEVAIDLYEMNPDPLKKDRTLLQNLGTDAMRSVVDGKGHHWDDVWIRYLIRQMDYHICHTEELAGGGLDLQMVDDMRFPNEAKELKQAGFLLVYIAVPRSVRQERLGYTDRQMSECEAHISETALDEFEDWDMVINGNVPIEKVPGMAQSILAYWKSQLGGSE